MYNYKEGVFIEDSEGVLGLIVRITYKYIVLNGNIRIRIYGMKRKLQFWETQNLMYDSISWEFILGTKTAYVYFVY